jgi:hypothetical protein
VTPADWAVVAIFALAALALAVAARTARTPRVVCPICHQPVTPEYWCDGHATHMPANAGRNHR